MSYSRLWTVFIALSVILGGMWLSTARAFAQDTAPNPGAETARGAGMWTLVEVTPDGYTVWRQQIDSGCSYSDHNYTLDVDAEPDEMSDISYSMTNFDVDYNDPQFCEQGPEVDQMQLNGNTLGILTGANESWSVNTWPIDKSMVISGSNQIYIDTDSTGTGCWCVGVGYIEVKAKLGFKVVKFTPQADDKNRDFHKDNLDLTVTFSTSYDQATLTNDTFKLEYRDQAGAFQQVAGSFTQVAAETFRFVPSADLKDGVRYRVTVKGGDAGVKAVNGNKLDADTEWYFWTVPDLSKTDAFDYGSGSVCPPSTSPCAGLEVVVFQTARNASMVEAKAAVARLYVRWKKHDDVLDADQLKTLDVNAKITVDGTSTEQRATVKRPDEYNAAAKASAANSVNVYHTPGSAFAYSAEVTPQPQTNATPVKYTGALNLASTGKKPAVKFNYYFLKDGTWAGGVPGGVKTTGRALFTNGIQYMQDVFPISSAQYVEQGDYTIGYTRTVMITDTFAGCGQVWQVQCPGFTDRPELQCVYDKLETMLGGNPFVAATVPGALCTSATGMAYRHVFVHLDGNGANYGTVVHEAGHIYTLGHIDPANNIEGFQVRTMTNRSFVESPANLESLMHTVVKPSNHQWIDNAQYNTLIGAISAASVSAASTAQNQYLIVSGYIYTETDSVELIPPYLQDVPNSPPVASGVCTIELLDGSDQVLASDFAPLQSVLGLTPSAPGASHTEIVRADPFFTVSLPWSESATTLRITCGGPPLLELARTAAKPVVNFVTPAAGATLSGVETIEWSGSDADSAPINYQLQFSDDGGASWLPLIPLGPNTSADVDTTRLPTGNNRRLRVLATDGFNSTFVERTVNLENPVSILGLLPGDQETGVPVNTTIQAYFASDIVPDSLSDEFELRDNSSFALVEGTVSYNAASHMVIFTPQHPLAAHRTYTARMSVSNGITDTNGNLLPFTQWSFTTGGETIIPYVVSNHPAQDALNVPINTLVQVQFSEAMSTTTVTKTTTFQLLDESSDPVAGTVYYDEASWSATFIPNANLAPNETYTARITTDARDLAGNPLGEPHSWQFTTGSTATLQGFRIVGNYNEQSVDEDGDGLYELLHIFVDVEVREEDYYNLNGRLVDSLGRLIEWSTTGDLQLTPGLHRLTLTYHGDAIRSSGRDGSYLLGSLNLYKVFEPDTYDRVDSAFQTFPYAVEDFFGILTLSSLPNQLLEMGTTRANAFNLHDFTNHVERPVSDITYSIFINTSPSLTVQIDTDANIDILPPADLEAESDIYIEARDPEGNRSVSQFHVSVQAARAAQLDVQVATTVTTYSNNLVQVSIEDQFDRAYTEPVTVSFESTVGTVSPAQVTSTNGTASASFRPGSTSGTGFITIRVGNVVQQVRVEVLEGDARVLLPTVHK